MSRAEPRWPGEERRATKRRKANPLILSLPNIGDYPNLFNAGLIEATGKAGLNIAATFVNNGAGTILAANGSIVRLESAIVEGGMLATAGTGIILASGGSTVGGTITNAGVLQDFGETMYAWGAFTNTGKINLSDEVTGAVLVVDPVGLTLTGGGTVTLTDNFQNGIREISSHITTYALTNVDNTIAGAGTIGGNDLSVINQGKGVINATGAFNPLIVSTVGYTLVNDGLMEATGAAGLNIAGMAVDATGGGTMSVGAGSIVRLESASLIGGALTNAASGQIVASGGSSLAGVSVVNKGLLTVVDGDTLSAAGSIANSGTVSLAGTSAGANLTLTGSLTLSGGGKVLLGVSIGAAAAGDALTNIDNIITGDGELGGGSMTLNNMAGGVIDETGTGGLLISAPTTTNAGLIEASGAGDISDIGVVQNSGTLQANSGSMFSLVGAVNNTGVLEANGGTMVVFKTVTGAGRAVIAGGTLEFDKVFDQNVAFTGSSGVLDLARSRSYFHTVSGFSTTGGTSFDLKDVHFVSAGEATFSGTAAGGTLTVTDGIDSAQIMLSGNYLGAGFVASRDGHGGVIVKTTSGAAAAAAPHAFISAMAALAGPAAPLHLPEHPGHTAAALIASPRTALA